MLKLPGSNKGAGRLGLVSSAQDGVHSQLENRVRRHLAMRWSQPFHKPTIGVFARLQESGMLSEAEMEGIDAATRTTIDRAAEEAATMPEPSPDAMEDEVYAP